MQQPVRQDLARERAARQRRAPVLDRRDDSSTRATSLLQIGPLSTCTAVEAGSQKA